MINRLEIIDHTECTECGDVHGRTVVVDPSENKVVEATIQDGGKTLKLFINEA